MQESTKVTLSRKFIELFAGCGGMSLGLHASNFELVLANELSPMAAETFAFNHLATDLQTLSTNDQKTPNKIKWLTSQHSRADLKARLRENPHDFPEWSTGVESDLTDHETFSSKKLVIGSIVTLNNYLESRESTPGLKPVAFDVDLVSGGPPCQSFSMAGLRQRENTRNTLPWEFAKFVSYAKPKVALLENVSGILRPFREGEETFHAWIEVAKAFASIGYAPICLHVNAKNVGVAQNRPRFLMFAIKEEVIRRISIESLNSAENKIINQAISSLNTEYQWDNFKYWDATSKSDAKLFQGSIFAPLNTHNSPQKWVTVTDAIDDLQTESNSSKAKSTYVRENNLQFKIAHNSEKIRNHELRKHGARVRSRFRLLQVLEKINDVALTHDIRNYFRTGLMPLGYQAQIEKLVGHELLFNGEEAIRHPENTDEVLILLNDLKTRKHSQRALSSSKPAPAALSIPDDCCHYAPTQLRTLSVREMARIQSFPDSFIVRSKVTTGGVNRRYEVPQYTQIGNAVPPILARQAGEVVNRILKLSEESKAHD